MVYAEDEKMPEKIFVQLLAEKETLLTLSMPHVTIVAISHLVEKVPSLELLHATEFSVRLA